LHKIPQEILTIEDELDALASEMGGLSADFRIATASHQQKK